MIIDEGECADPFSDASGRPASIAETVLPDYVPDEYAAGTSGPRPPSYFPPTRPTKPLTYTFSSWNANLMFLLPPPQPPRTPRADRAPVCNISVALDLNPFAPLAYITTVRRGGMTDGALVGEFEMAIAHKRATVKMGESWTRLSNVLFQTKSAKQWKWKCDGVELHWDCRNKLDDGSPMCICSDYEGSQLASFVPPPIDASPPLPEATLTVFPSGHEYFDHILISALIVERKMTLSA